MSEPLTIWVCPTCGATADPTNRDETWRFAPGLGGLVEHVHDGIRSLCRAVRVFPEDDLLRLVAAARAYLVNADPMPPDGIDLGLELAHALRDFPATALGEEQ